MVNGDGAHYFFHFFFFGRCLMDIDEFSMHNRHGILFDFSFSYSQFTVVHVTDVLPCFVCWFHPYVFHCIVNRTYSVFVWSMTVGILNVILLQYYVYRRVASLLQHFTGRPGERWCMGTKNRTLAENILSCLQPHTVFSHKWFLSVSSTLSLSLTEIFISDE